MRWVEARQQELLSKSFSERLSEAYENIPASRSTTDIASVESQTPSHARQETAAAGRNLATLSYPSTTPPPAPATAAAPSPAPSKKGLNADLSTTSAATSTDTGIAMSWYVDPTIEPSEVPPAIAAVSGSEASNPVVDSMLQQNAPPAPYAPVGAGSTDPAVFRTDGYIKALNLNSFLQAANHDNEYRFNQYKYQLHEWSEHGMEGPPPAPPKYESVDLKQFDNWWTQYCANMGEDAPSSTMCVVNGSKNGGYGWTSA